MIAGTCLFNLHASGDDEKVKPVIRKWKVGALLHGGEPVNHSGRVTPILERSAYAAEVFFSKQTFGEQEWHSFFNYPEYGLSYTLLDLGSPHYTGLTHCLLPYMNFHFFNNYSRMNLNLKVGIGLAYVEKIYDAETNPLNLAFGTHLNSVLSLQLHGSYRISNDWSLLLGGGITHLSNGAIKMPNSGLNVVSLFTGASYSFGERRLFSYTENKEKVRNWNYTLFMTTGIKEIKPIGGDLYFAGGLSFEVTRRHLKYTRFGLTLDLNYDASDYDALIYSSIPTDDRLKTAKAGIAGGYTVIFGRLSANLYLGTYLYAKNTQYGNIYQRTAIRYALSDRWSLQGGLRNHRGKADYIEFGLGCRLNK